MNIVAAIVASLLLGVVSGWLGHAQYVEGRDAKVHAEYLQARIDAQAADSAERARMLMTRDQEIDRAQAESASQARNAAALRVTSERLRQHIPRLAKASAVTTAAGSSAPATGPGLVLTDLYRGTDEAVDLAIAYDAARAAGIACERAYEIARHVE